MNVTDFNLTNINKTLRKATLNQKVNYCQFISTSFSEKLSIIGREDDSLDFFTLNENLATELVKEKGCFYGASPLLDNKLILESISTLKFKTKEGLDSFISQHHNMFAITRQFEKSLLSLARYITIAFASNFGISINVEKETEEFDRFAKSFPFSVEKVKEEDNKKRNKKCEVKYFIRGCPTQSMLEFLSKFRYKKTDKHGDFIISERGEEIVSIYSKIGNIVLKNGAVFYSGVIPKTTKVEIIENVYENYKTNAILLHYVQSSFATVFALDRNFTEHPLLSEDKLNIIKILKDDDIAKMQMINRLDTLAYNNSQTPQAIIESVNKYLSASINVNQIGVSANLTTENNVLLLGKRGLKTNSYDNEELYPSANGNVEFADERVSFYQYSAHEDVPTMRRGSIRNDFTGEIARETESELSIFCDNSDFSCVGLTICGNIPNSEDIKNDSNDKYFALSRRCHLNIIYDAHIKESYEEVRVKSKNANEAFENEKFRGVQVNCYKNRLTRGLSFIKSILNFISDNKDFFESVLIIILAIGSLFSLQKLEENNLSSWFSTSLALLVLLSTLIKFVKQSVIFIRRLVNSRSVTIFKKDSIHKLERKTIKSFGQKKYHPVTFAMVTLYVEQMAYKHFFDKGRRE